jgi:hypothetical protein
MITIEDLRQHQEKISNHWRAVADYLQYSRRAKEVMPTDWPGKLCKIVNIKRALHQGIHLRIAPKTVTSSRLFQIDKIFLQINGLSLLIKPPYSQSL